jgi:hypothetical protein
MNLQSPGNFACKDNHVRRERPQITMNINADNNDRDTNRRVAFVAALAVPQRGRPQGARRTISNRVERIKKPGTVSRPGTRSEFQFPESTESGPFVKPSSSR